MSEGTGNGKDGRPKILYACSGAANTGEMADKIARALWGAGNAKRSCLAGVGAGLPSYVDGAKEADNLVIDGCPIACGRKIFEERGIAFKHFVLTEHGVEKGKTAVDEGIIASLREKAEAAFGI
jgi:uncharacterized metal-binding protein